MDLEVLVRRNTAPAALHNAHTIGVTVLGQEDILCLFPLPLLVLPRVRVLNHSGLNHPKIPCAYAAIGWCEISQNSTLLCLVAGRALQHRFFLLTRIWHDRYALAAMEA